MKHKYKHKKIKKGDMHFLACIQHFKHILKRSRERLKRTWDEQIKADLHELNLPEGLTRDTGSWRHHIHVLDY